MSEEAAALDTEEVDEETSILHSNHDCTTSMSRGNAQGSPATLTITPTIPYLPQRFQSFP